MARTIRNTDYNANNKVNRFARETKHRSVRAATRRGLELMRHDMGLIDAATLPVPVRQHSRTI